MVRVLFIAACLLFLPAATVLGGEVNWQDVSLDLPQPQLGRPFPDLELPDTDGVITALSMRRGRPILVAFCACYAETACSVLRTIEKIRSEYGDAVEVVLVCSEVASSWRKQGYDSLLRRAEGLVDVVLIDEEGKTRVPYLVGSYPTTYLVDRDFILRFHGRSIADLNGEKFRTELKDRLGP